MSGSGSQLQEQRLARHLSVFDVAERTKIRASTIEAMERDDYARLYAPTYAKGFYREYCALLGLDAAPFIDAYLVAIGRPPESSPAPAKKRGFFSRKSVAREAKAQTAERARAIADARERAAAEAAARAEAEAQRPAGPS
ncbi:MAG: helix-turn-helix domain-containing protein, partial [Kiritimatiellae bacterium]|nr:helix-turn-helix domain-containing protein [Kiritimatiellia bacterium]